MRNRNIKPPVPQDDRRGCLCWDTNTYSRECCDGEYQSQGIGSIYGNILSGDSLTLSGFSVAQDGTITTPTSDIGTVTSVTPTSFPIVDADTSRTVTVCVTVPEGYSNSGDEICTTDTVTQLATPTLACSDITFTGFAVSQGGVITLPTIDIGTISSTSPASFSTVSVDTVRTLNVNITVPSGYFNTGSTLACTTTATQTAIAEYTCTDVGTATIYIGTSGSFTASFSSGISYSSIDPASFASNTTLADIQRSIDFDFTVPDGYSNAGSTIENCNFNPYQPSKTKLYSTNNLTGVRTWRLKIKDTNVPDTSSSTFDLANITGKIQFFGYAQPTVVSGDSSGITWTESSAIYGTVGLGGFVAQLLSHKSDTQFTSLQTGAGNVSITVVTGSRDSSGNSVNPVSSAAVNMSIFNYTTDQHSGLLVDIQKSNEQGYNIASNFATTIADGYYCRTSENAQIRVQSGIITEYSTIT